MKYLLLNLWQKIGYGFMSKTLDIKILHLSYT